MSASPILWQPSRAAIADARITAYMQRLGRTDRPDAPAYDELWRWSTDDLEGFWRSIWDEFDVMAATPATAVLSGRTMPGASWFEGATLNYAEHLLRPGGDRIAIRAFAEGASPREVTRDDLARAVGSVASALRALGVSRGDRVAAFLPNGIEAVVALLATASIGAIWSACSPDFGPGAVIDRFRQIEPAVLVAADGYRYGGREHDRIDVVTSIVDQLPSLRTVVVANLHEHERRIPGAQPWEEFLAEPQEPVFAPVPFSHPLWIVYSSGKTGLPKAMVQGHGGILLEHLKSLGMHLDLGQDDRLFWFTTTGWMMWNFIVSALALGTSLVLYDGSPATPDLGALWRLAERAGITYFGTSAPFLHMSMRRRVRPRDVGDLSALRAIGSTGAPLSPEGFRWVYDRLGPEIWLGSISGGTDLCTAFVGSCPVLPVYEGDPVPVARREDRRVRRERSTRDGSRR